MELLLINNTKLKVTLSEDDMTVYSLTCDNIDYDNTETRKAFWCILNEAKQKTGFDAASDRVFIQIYPCRKGGCEMYVTKLPQSTGTNGYTVRKLTKATEKFVWSFDSMKLLLTFCNCLLTSKAKAVSSAWKADSCYYLCAELEYASDTTDSLHNISICDIAEEFGERLDNLAEAYLTEHGSVICKEKAIENLGILL